MKMSSVVVDSKVDVVLVVGSMVELCCVVVCFSEVSFGEVDMAVEYVVDGVRDMVVVV